MTWKAIFREASFPFPSLHHFPHPTSDKQPLLLVSRLSFQCFSSTRLKLSRYGCVINVHSFSSIFLLQKPTSYIRCSAPWFFPPTNDMSYNRSILAHGGLSHSSLHSHSTPRVHGSIVLCSQWLRPGRGPGQRRRKEGRTEAEGKYFYIWSFYSL